MNEILDLLPIAAERDLPPGQLAARRDALVAAIRRTPPPNRLPAARCVPHADTSPEPWLSVLGMLALGLAVVFSGVSGQHRTAQSDAVAVLAMTVPAQIAVSSAPATGDNGPTSGREPALRAGAILPLAFVLLLVVGCGCSSRRDCSVVFRAVPTKGQPVTAAGMRKRSRSSRPRRHVGVSSPKSRPRGRVMIEYGGSHAPADLAKTLARPAGSRCSTSSRASSRRA